MLVPFFAFLLASFIGGGLNGVFIRFVSTDFGPLTGTFLRFLGAAIILFPSWYKRKELLEVRDLYKIAPFSINVSLFSIAIQYTSVIMYNILYSIVPVLVALLGFFILRERLLREHIAGLIISLLGIAILIKGSLVTGDILTFGKPLGNALVLTGAFFWSFWMIGSRSISKKYSSLTIIFYCFLMTAVILIALLPFEWQRRPIDFSTITYSGLGSLLGVITLSSVILYLLHQWLIKNTSAFIASLIQYGAILFGALFGPLVFRERFTLELFIGGAFVVAGVFLATTYSQLKKRM